MNFQQQGGVAIPQQLDKSDLSNSKGLGSVLTRLNIILNQTSRKLQTGASVAGKMTVAGEKYYSEVKRFIARDELFSETGTSSADVVNNLVKKSSVFVFDKKTNKESSKTLQKLMKKHGILNSIYKLNGDLKKLYLNNGSVETHNFGENQASYKVPGESNENSMTNTATNSEKLPSLLQSLFSAPDKYPVILLNRTMPSNEELLKMFSLPKLGKNKSTIPGLMMMNKDLVLASDKVCFNIIPVPAKIKGRSVTLCAVGLCLNKYGLSKELKTKFENGIEELGKSVAEVKSNSVHLQTILPKRKSKTRSSSSTSSRSRKSTSNSLPPLPPRRRTYLTKKFDKVVKDGNTVSPEAVQLVFSKSQKNAKNGKNNSNSNSPVTYASIAGKKKSKKSKKSKKKTSVKGKK